MEIGGPPESGFMGFLRALFGPGLLGAVFGVFLFSFLPKVFYLTFSQAYPAKPAVKLAYQQTMGPFWSMIHGAPLEPLAFVAPLAGLVIVTGITVLYRRDDL